MVDAAGNGEDFKVLIAGGGVAGLEAILALREVAMGSLSIELLSPDPDFVLAPLSVVEPFGAEDAPSLPLAEICREHLAEYANDGLSEIWPDQRRVLTDGGTEIPYDALLLCMGAGRRVLLPDAINFRGGHDTDAIEELVTTAAAAGSGRIAFVVADDVNWPLPLYELALQIADRLRETEVEISFLTAEPAPLHVFGEAASARLAGILAEAGIELETDRRERLAAPGASVGADWIVTVPRLEVHEIPGLPQVSHGFVPVDATMRVHGTPGVWAVGDLTWSPIKQGGLAAQQADIAAADILREAGADVEVPAYAPVLRAALMTADGPFYLRSGTTEDGEQRAPLWWPPAKVAGRLLAPYLGRKVDPTITNERLLDLDADTARDVEHGEALDLSLQWADVDASQGDYRRALHWIEVAEGLNLVVPDSYREKQRQWREKLGRPSRDE